MPRRLLIAISINFAATFSFTMVGVVAGTNPATRNVTSGAFDVTL